VADGRSRSERLVQRIGEALDRGVRPETIRDELVRRNMPREKANALIARILERRRCSTAPDPEAAQAPKQPLTPSFESLKPSAYRFRTPALSLGIAAILLLAGYTGLFLATRGSAERERVEIATRLGAEVSAAREHIRHLESQLELRKVDAEQIEWFRARIARGPLSYPTSEAYRRAVGRYHRRVESWNRTLPEYQVVAGAYRTIVDIHNMKLDSLTAISPGQAQVQRAVVDEEGSRIRISAATR
jgi:hypothetical protein